MKLFYRVIGRLSVTLIIILAIWAGLFYFALMDEVNDEVKIFQNALDFSDTKVRDCMVPRTEIQAVEMETSLEELQQKFIESGNSKIIVYEEDIDHIAGYIHSSELFHHPSRWQDHIRTLPFVPETM